MQNNEAAQVPVVIEKLLVFINEKDKNHSSGRHKNMLMRRSAQLSFQEGCMLFSKAVGLAAFSGLVLTLAGCANSPVPLAQNFEVTSQNKVRSAGHWDLLARDVVSQTQASVDKLGFAIGTGMHVGLPANPSAFDKAFREFVITRLVQSGKPVYETPGQPLEVTYSTQVVRHNSPRPQFIPGGYTMLTAGLIAAYGLRFEHLDTKLVAATALAGGADYAASVNAGGPTHTELILTTTVSRGGQYVARKTDVYYIESDDSPLFVAATNKGVNLKVVGQ